MNIEENLNLIDFGVSQVKVITEGVSSALKRVFDGSVSAMIPEGKYKGRYGVVKHAHLDDGVVYAIIYPYLIRGEVGVNNLVSENSHIRTYFDMSKVKMFVKDITKEQIIARDEYEGCGLDNVYRR